MELLIKLNSQAAGKDKIARLLQYSCRAAWDSLPKSQNYYSYFELINDLKTIENLLSNFRKCKKFRLINNFYYSIFS